MPSPEFPRGHARTPAPKLTAAGRRDTVLSVAIVLVLGLAGAVALAVTRPAAPGNAAPAAATRQRPTPAGTSLASPVAGRTRKPVTFTVAWVGDMTFGTLNAYPPGGPGSLLAAAKPYLHSTLTIGNLETVLGDLPMSKCGPHESDCYQFEAPATTAADLKADGFAAVNVANNHTLDAGLAGETSTDDALRGAGLKYAGRPGQITYLRRNGIRIALLGFAPWPYDADALDISAAQALVRRASRHARVVIVMEHLGAEGDAARHVTDAEEYFLGQDRGNPVAFTHAVIDAGADLVVGSGPHVLRGFQWYHGHLIAYSLGNFCGYSTLGLDAYTSVSAVLHVTLSDRGQFVRGGITPLRLVSPGTPQRDPAGTAVSYVNALSGQDFGGNGAVRLSASGRIEKS